MALQYYTQANVPANYTPPPNKEPNPGEIGILNKCIKIKIDLEELSKAISKFFAYEGLENILPKSINSGNNVWHFCISDVNALEIVIYKTDGIRNYFCIDLSYRYLYINDLDIELFRGQFYRLFEYICNIHNVLTRIKYLKFVSSVISKFSRGKETPIQKFVMSQKNEARPDWKMHILSFLSKKVEISKFE